MTHMTNSSIHHRGFIVLLFVCLIFSSTAHAELPEWIWHDQRGVTIKSNDVRYFRKTFSVGAKPAKALLSVAADDEAIVYLNGKEVTRSTGYDKPAYVDVKSSLRDGENIIAIRGKNVAADVAAVVALLELQLPKRQRQVVMTDTSWVSAATKGDTNWTSLGFDAAKWTHAVSKGKLGVKPWGDVMKLPEATPAKDLTVPPGFKVELIHNSEPGEGSWVAMTIDPLGRLIISPQNGKTNLLRVTLKRDGSVDSVEKMRAPVGSAMGLLYALDSLFVNGDGPKGLGLYRLKDTRANGNFDSVKLVRALEKPEGEHGSHAVLLGPDKKLYVINGNFVKIPKDISPKSPHKNYADDQMLLRAQDGNGFGNGVLPPGGFVLRMDADGKNCQLFCAGLRNTYDFGFNPQGELFGFDSDMEWDWGTPWYRPIRILHLVSGGDYGFREGTGKFPEYYADTLPSALRVGIGSPTGMKFGTMSNFPQQFRDALFSMDWSYGRILAVHLRPNGASYTATSEDFVKGKPLNVTDLEFGKDGAMYFITGGRGTQSGLYRVSYVGEKVKDSAKADSKAAEKARDLRHALEKFHGKVDKKAVAFAWPHLDSSDRWIRYAARIAIESQPVAEWRDHAINETRTNAALTALLALARLGGKETQNDLLLALKKLPMDGLSESQQLEKLRVIEVSFTRQGRPSPEMAKLAIAKLDRLYPAASEALNRELCQLLIYLDAPGVVGKTLALLDAAPTQEGQLNYIFRLRTVTNGWTMDERKHYFQWFNFEREAGKDEASYPNGSPYHVWANQKKAAERHPADVLRWFNDAGREYGDGSSFPKFLANFQNEAIATLTEAQKKELEPILHPKAADTNSAVAAHSFVKEWKLEDLLPSLGEAGKGRSFKSGKDAFTAATCAACHKFGNDGGAIGPDLTAVSSRFQRRDILESIIEPSKVVSEQFQNVNIVKKSGIEVTGRIVEETPEKLVVLVNPLTGEKVDVKKESIEKREASKLSPMPTGLVNVLSKEEILDLIAYLESGGKKDSPAFKTR